MCGVNSLGEHNYTLYNKLKILMTQISFSFKAVQKKLGATNSIVLDVATVIIAALAIVIYMTLNVATIIFLL